MTSTAITCLAGFTVPMNITTGPFAIFWILPLLLLIALTYKAAKIEHFDMKQLTIESAKMFLSTVLVMTLITAVLWAIVYYAT